ncbi:MAG: hypothetical protein ACLFPE_04950 [Bacteroidales bacterium]
METSDKKYKSLIDNISRAEYLRVFRQFPKKKKLKIAEDINKEIFDEVWEELDASLPDVSDADNIIMREVSAVRYGTKK